MPCVCLMRRKYSELISAADSIQAMTVLVQPTPCLELKTFKKPQVLHFCKSSRYLSGKELLIFLNGWLVMLREECRTLENYVVPRGDMNQSFS